MANIITLVMTASALGILIFSLIAFYLSSLVKEESDKVLKISCPSSPEIVEDDNDIIVKVEQGLLKGRRVKSVAEGSYLSFQGIPYAKAPVGLLRFKDAQPPDTWEGVRIALREGNICPQFAKDRFIGNEDCLFLNVYTPTLSKKKALPVMVWFHGGAFDEGSGNSDVYGPDYLVAEGVIVVTLNYRLGPLGFLYLNETAPGNAGMKDQVAALRWVQRNIGAFGGDSTWITIFGQSAGSASVHLHMLSPLTKGLFQGAIAQSGSAIDKSFSQSSPEEVSISLAVEVGCPVTNYSATIGCLRGLSAEVLVSASFTMTQIGLDKNRLLGRPFRPSVDMFVPGVAQYLPASPLDMVTMGTQHDLPFISGSTRKEGLFIIKKYNILDEEVLKNFDSSWNEIIYSDLFLPIDDSKINAAMQEIRNHYLDGQQLTKETLPKFLDLITDMHSESVFFSLREMSKTRKTIEPLYQYLFNVEDELNSKKNLPEVLQGADHGDDLHYLFHMKGLPEVSENSTAALARTRMVHLWTNFVRYGRPVLLRDRVLQTRWEQFSERSRNFLEIGSVLREDTRPNGDASAFWEQFYEKYAPKTVNNSKTFSPHVKIANS